MADDITLNPSSGGPVVATDDSGTGHVQLVKLAYSADGSRTHVLADADGLKVKVGNTVFVSLNDPLPSGTNVIGGVTQSGTWNVGLSGTPTVTVGNASIAVTDGGGSLTVDGSVTVGGTVTVGNASIPVTDNGESLTVDGTVAATQSGTWTVKRSHKPTPYKRNSAASTNATSVSTAADTLLYGYYISNTNAAVRYVKFYNKASAPTVGTDTPVLVLAIPGSGAANASFPAGINFTTGLAFATTTGAADADTAAVAANEIIVNLVYATY